MMVVEDLKQEMSLRNISRISGISLSGYYYKSTERHILRGLIHKSVKGSRTLHQRGQHTDSGECGQFFVTLLQK